MLVDPKSCCLHLRTGLYAGAQTWNRQSAIVPGIDTAGRVARIHDLWTHHHGTVVMARMMGEDQHATVLILFFQECALHLQVVLAALPINGKDGSLWLIAAPVFCGGSMLASAESSRKSSTPQDQDFRISGRIREPSS